MENLEKLITELCKYDNETQWIEFKHNNYKAEMIGTDISALANSAALLERNCAYMIWGIDDATHEIIGTEYDLQTLKIGNQEIENWLRSLLSKNADFESYSITINDKKVTILIINRATNQTVTFKKVDYIRVGSYTKKLNEYPTLQAQLWNKINNSKFEERYSKIDLELNDALQLLNYSTYFDLKELPQPVDITGISHYMLEENILVRQDNGLFAITNLGAILFAKNLNDFSRLSRKAVRVIQYKGINRLNMLKEYVGRKGYVAGFENLIRFIEALTPSEEDINDGLRKKKTAYPTLAILEAVANALIHQDFSIPGTGPTIEIFENRIEITNSGIPLVDIKRIIDNPPKSRNEKLASLMRRLGICEELGTGWDKIILTCEAALLPAPKIDLFEDSIRVTLFSKIPFTNLSMEDKTWACYLHACIKYVQGEQLTNSSLRERFGLGASSSAVISRLIKETIRLKLIKPFDPTTSNKYMKYIPIWA